jgi:hypothetical protein
MIYLEYEGLQSLFGVSEVPVHIAAVICHWICAVLIYFLILRLGFAEWIACIGAFLYPLIAAPPWFQSWTGRTDLFMQPWLLASFLLVMDRRRWARFGAGALWSLAFFTKQTAAVYAPLYLILSPQGWLETTVEMLLGADLIASAVAAPFYFTDRMGDFWGAVWGINTRYIASGWQLAASSEARLIGILQWFSKASLSYVGFVPAYFILVRNALRELKIRTQHKPFLIGCIWSALAVLGCGLSGRMANYYFLVMLAPLAIVGALAVSTASSKFWRYGLIIAMVIPLIVTAIWSWMEPRPSLGMSWYDVDRLESSQKVGEEIMNSSVPGDRLLAWTSEPGIYLYAKLPMALVPTPLANHLAFMSDKLEGVRIEFSFSRPKFVVLSEFEQTYASPPWLKEETSVHYKVTNKIGPYTIFALK